ncbi:hypothetical protein COY17_04405 [Candidatus Saccharibacteria bacterium CG_4_10_14_0_2_um_filter_52_9]|nr:MAG: hypothetical protein COY17_04405 [Candidatus Saccharibacteria bacterium CG_4_10_14_0_2_um_filter_52_9]
MSLTKQDLVSIRTIVKEVVDESDLIAAKAFNDVYSRFDQVNTRLDKVNETVARIGNIQQAELERNDRQDQSLKGIRKALRAT